MAGKTRTSWELLSTCGSLGLPPSMVAWRDLDFLAVVKLGGDEMQM